MWGKMYILESVTFGCLVFSWHFSCNNPKLSSPHEACGYPRPTTVKIVVSKDKMEKHINHFPNIIFVKQAFWPKFLTCLSSKSLING